MPDQEPPRTRIEIPAYVTPWRGLSDPELRAIAPRGADIARVSPGPGYATPAFVERFSS